MKLIPETSLIHLANSGQEGKNGARPRPGAQATGALDFLSQLRDGSGVGDQAAPPSSRGLQPGILEVSMLTGVVTVPLAAHRSIDTARAGTEEARPGIDAASVRAPSATDKARSGTEADLARGSKAIEVTRAATLVGDARTSAELINVASVDWPWLAIATGALSYRPTSGAAASLEVSEGGVSLAVRASAVPAEAHVATKAVGPVDAKASGSTPLSAMLSLGTTTVGSPADGSAAAGELDFAAWPLPAELRELLERRRLRLVEDGHGGLQLFARDFALDDTQAAHWAAALREACQFMKQPLRALWINGRAYEVQQGERHDR